jgi:hypothetical protein
MRSHICSFVGNNLSGQIVRCIRKCEKCCTRSYKWWNHLGPDRCSSISWPLSAYFKASNCRPWAWCIDARLMRDEGYGARSLGQWPLGNATVVIAKALDSKLSTVFSLIASFMTCGSCCWLRSTCFILPKKRIWWLFICLSHLAPDSKSVVASISTSVPTAAVKEVLRL